MSNQSKWVISGLGALWAGAVLVPLDYKLTPDEQLALLAHASRGADHRVPRVARCCSSRT